ncbi:Fic family protein [Corynebacterium felinum]|uniref:Fic family protein n=1 Tax=Corynebacterium felinum TaxID=131318 RepID=A0ABU2BA33_9CORY|nr:Fic family protein [Corynebacterium felinum]MDF5819624.1 Fic family protein [Corynebacterium felinum]MDR7354244.1 Fic family protein [Corynebacterium felinum]WJY96412.1 Fic/DOC family protein [Corynebacterium felinum]
MAQYRSLKAKFHASDQARADELYRARITSGTSIRWDFPIRDFRNQTEWPLWCELTVPIVGMMEKIYHNELLIATLYLRLSPVARRHYMLRLIANEVVDTNAIEQVPSTHTELAVALARLEKPQGAKSVRFQHAARLFHRLGDGTLDIPSSAQQLKDLYLQFLEGEIDQADALDGTLFRAQQVSVFSPARGEIHRGIEPEEKIIEAVEMMLATLHDENNPQLINALISHFMFEYAHPFYDGNGRCGRFLLGLSLSKICSPLVALTLSTVIYEQKEEYFNAFEQVEKPDNRGDATEFIATLLEFVHRAQLRVIGQLHVLIQQLTTVLQKIEEAQVGDRRMEKNLALVLSVVAEVEICGLGDGVTRMELARWREKSPTQTRRYLRQLAERGLISETSTRPKRYSLSDAGCKMLGI